MYYNYYPYKLCVQYSFKLELLYLRWLFIKLGFLFDLLARILVWMCLVLFKRTENIRYLSKLGVYLV